MCGDLLYPISPKSVEHRSTVRNTFTTCKQVLRSLNRFSDEIDAYPKMFCEEHRDECNENQRRYSVTDGSCICISGFDRRHSFVYSVNNGLELTQYKLYYKILLLRFTSCFVGP
jgi:hypothetical protein